MVMSVKIIYKLMLQLKLTFSKKILNSDLCNNDDAVEAESQSESGTL